MNPNAIILKADSTMKIIVNDKSIYEDIFAV